MGISTKNGKLFVKLNYNGIDYKAEFDTREALNSWIDSITRNENN